MEEQKILKVRVDQLLLNTHNPRHEAFQSETEIYDYLCRKEKLLNMAKDIVNLQSISPLELLAVIRINDSSYRVLEGNRRVAALKLLHNPDLAPTKCKSIFHKLSINLRKNNSLFLINVVVFDNEDDARPWIERLHTGERDGIGRRKWNAQQKERFMKQGQHQSRHWKGMWLLEFAYENKITKKEEAEKWLNIIDRWLSNPEFRAALGIVVDYNKYTVELEPFLANKKDVFVCLIEKFVDDIRNKQISTRAKAEDMKNMASQYNQFKMNCLTSSDRSPPKKNTIDINQTRGNAPNGTDALVDIVNNNRNITASTSSRENSSINKLHANSTISSMLNDSLYIKHMLLYRSLTSINVKTHSVLIAVGIWSFIESLANLAGKSKTDFLSFFSKDRLQNVYDFDKEKSKSIRAALKNINEYGNLTKHDANYAHADAQQLIMSWNTIIPLLIKVISNIKVGRSGDK